MAGQVGRKRRPAAAPKHLTVEAARLWERLKNEWGVEDEAGLLILQTAMEAFDRMRAAQAEIKKAGLVVPDRFDQPKPNPACTVERDSRAAMLAAIKQLGIEPDDSE